MTEVIDKLDFIKSKNSYSTSDNTKRTRRQVADCLANNTSEKIFANNIFETLLHAVYLQGNANQNNSELPLHTY